jgi:hypothetical protein
MLHVHLISETNSLLIHGLVYPSRDEIDLGMASGLSQSGDILISKRTGPALTLTRAFAGVRDEEYQALKDWYLNEAEGPRRSFTFIDSDGTSYIVRWMNGPGDWQKDGINRWSGSMKLLVEE